MSEDIRRKLTRYSETMKTTDIKLLWGKAGFRCAICKRELSATTTATALIGEMTHIVAESDSGPRANPSMPIEERNSYGNLLLLCPTDHSRIDNDVSAWPVARLHEIKREHETWVSARLSDGSITIDANEAIHRIARVIERNQALPSVLAGNIGNARFLDALQKSDEWFWLRMNADKAFRDGYIDMLEQQAKALWQQSAPPFRFEMLDGLVVFPDGYEEYRSIFPVSASEPRAVPFYVSDTRLVEANGQRHLQHGTCVEVPWIPRRNGFIRKRDSATGLPSEVGDDPSEQEWGAYYWVRPSGCRISVMGIGVLDPMEVGGFALWWGPKDASPLLSVRGCREATPELRQAMHEAMKKTYLRVAERWASPSAPISAENISTQNG
jgi:hypothetical protein